MMIIRASAQDYDRLPHCIFVIALGTIKTGTPGDPQQDLHDDWVLYVRRQSFEIHCEDIILILGHVNRVRLVDCKYTYVIGNPSVLSGPTNSFDRPR